MLHMYAPETIDPALQRSFQDQFERLVVLDYITRNTGESLSGDCEIACGWVCVSVGGWVGAGGAVRQDADVRVRLRFPPQQREKPKTDGEELAHQGDKLAFHPVV